MDREVKPFKLVSKFSPTGDQPAAIESILKGIEAGKKVQVIRGATGTGKTFTDANIIAALLTYRIGTIPGGCRKKHPKPFL